MVHTMESEDSSSSSLPESLPGYTATSPSKEGEQEEAATGTAETDNAATSIAGTEAAGSRPHSSSSNSSSSSSSSSPSARSQSKKKSSSSSSDSDSSDSSSSSSSSSSEDDDDDDEEPRRQKLLTDAVVSSTDVIAVTSADDAAIKDAGNAASGDGNGGDAQVMEDSSKSASNPSKISRKSASPVQVYTQMSSELNISHEDLSDVSDIDMEKQVPASKSPLNGDKNAPASSSSAAVVAHDFEVDDEEGAISNDSLPPVGDCTSPVAQHNGKSPSTATSTSVTKSINAMDNLNGLGRPLANTHNDDSLDFEAEEGECPELHKQLDAEGDHAGSAVNANKLANKEFNKNDDDDEDEDGKLSDDDVEDGKLPDVGNGGNGDNADATGENAKRKKKDEELEEGEVSDEDEKRPEETEPKPVCRFYTRGQCTWGMSCRFLHPGVTDKGNYTMFESLVRSVPMQSGGGGNSGRAPGSSGYGNHMISTSSAPDYHDYRSERPVALHHRGPGGMHHSSMYANSGGGGSGGGGGGVGPAGGGGGASGSSGGHHDGRGGMMMSDGPVMVENAWERGLRTAKEMMRKANKRKEQDMDFEDKKMNLTLSPDELEKDPYYLKERGASPNPVRELPPNNAIAHGNPRAMMPSVYSMYGQQDRYRPMYTMPPMYDDVDIYGRMARYRELPPHRMPQYEDDRRLRPAREVIVQRVEAVGRGDEWSDPWMRSKSIGRVGSYEREDRRRRDRRSYSTNSSYSSSNSSQSDSSSESSRSSSGSERKRRYSHKLMASSSSRRHAAGRGGRSPSHIPRRPRRTSKGSASSTYKRAALDKRSGTNVPHSPASKRKKLSPAPKKFDKMRRRRSSSSSDSESSGTSYSDSESGSSSSESSSGSHGSPHKRVRATDKVLNERKTIKKPTEQMSKKRSPISIEIKKPSTMVGVSALASPTVNSPDFDRDNGNAKDKDKDKGEKDKDGKKSRREELLKQLRAVEDAIAKKRSKLT